MLSSSPAAGAVAPARPVATRVLFDCTSTYSSRYNTGIQRASRKLVEAALLAHDVVRCEAVVYNGRELVAVDTLSPRLGSVARFDPTERLRRGFHQVRDAVARIVPSRALRDALYSQRLEYAARSAAHSVVNAWRGLRPSTGPTKERFEFCSGDVLILLDPEWSVDLTKQLLHARSAGVAVWAVVYDLIPILHPELAPEGKGILMDKWLRRIVPQVDGMLAISKTVAADLRTYLSRTKLPMPEIDHFYLGAGIAPVVGASASLDAVTAAFASGRDGVFLCVGTVEPRKNHGLVLDVFERLWASGSDARLVLFGRLGWRCDALARRMREHEQLNQRLFWFEAGSDIELEYAYRNASALVFASRNEGFGLPLVEAMHYGLPVIASDIAVFHEVAGDYPTYFNSMDAASLEAAITKRIHEHANGERRRCIPRAWLTWADSARVLLEKVTGASGPAAATQLGARQVRATEALR